jgi:membrane protein YqaA with SNARE-associated domain
MTSLFNSFLGYFLTLPGVVALGALDSSLVFFLPLGIDFAVIILSARHPQLFWAHSLLATAGSLIGAAVTFWIGREVGEHGLSRLVKAGRLKRIQERVKNSAGVSVAALAVIPPPFPFTAFVLTSGALKANPRSFFPTLAAMRLLRFGVETALARHYGRAILAWMNSTTFKIVIGALIVLAVLGTVVSGIALYRSSRRTTRTRRPALNPES